MPQDRGQPYRHSAYGVTDTLDGTQVKPGAQTYLQNLVPDPTTKNLWVPRPAAVNLSTFAGFTSPGFLSVMEVFGRYAYGMIASGLNAGKDQPFCFDIIAQSFITISGITSANTPLSPATSGAWEPPIMALVGTKVVVTHPGFDGVTYFFGHIDISNPLAPVWGAGNTATNPLPSRPMSVAQFYERAYFLCSPTGAEPSAIATDVLDPLTRTNATYVLTFGDNEPLTALAGLPLNTTIGGIVQSLIVFKGTSNIYQVTGDFAVASTIVTVPTGGGTTTQTTYTGTIAVNSLNVPTGTIAPRSIVSTQVGLAFMAPDGMRLIDFSARVSDPIGANGEGITAPFINAVVPSRVQAAAIADCVRISVQNGSAIGTPYQEWWYHISPKVWSGPHTLPATAIAAYQNTFIVAPQAVTATLLQSDALPTLTSSYTELGLPLQYLYQTALLAERQDMNECSMIETLIYLGLAPGGSGVAVSAQDQNGSVLAFANINPVGAQTVWGSFVWGQATWAGAPNALAARQVPWPAPVTFDRLALRILGTSGPGVRIGDCYFMYQKLDYLATP